MTKPRRGWNKTTMTCLCGCGRTFRFYPAWNNKFASKKCYIIFVRKLIADYIHKMHISAPPVEKNAF